MKNVTVSKHKENFEIKKIQSNIKPQEDNVVLNNTLEIEQQYNIYKCGERSHYTGLGTNYLKHMFGLDAYNVKGKKISYSDMPLSLTWIASPVALPIFTGFEILFLQPLYSYEDIRECDVKQDEKILNLSNYGQFNGKVTIDTLDGKEHIEYDYKNKPLPLKIPFVNQNDQFSVTKHSIDTSKGYIVTIKGEYYIDGKSIMINEQKTIKTK
jgi:hypothetical protein